MVWVILRWWWVLLWLSHVSATLGVSVRVVASIVTSVKGLSVHWGTQSCLGSVGSGTGVCRRSMRHPASSAFQVLSQPLMGHGSVSRGAAVEPGKPRAQHWDQGQQEVHENV